MMLPRLDGASTIRTIRGGEHQPLKVYAVSGATPDDYGVSGGVHGVDRWFPRPLDPANLLDAMEN
tara:strand:- start:158762 stop:158956 length:195 start_codon:yes stop_codon:yes gene_type:complete